MSQFPHNGDGNVIPEWRHHLPVFTTPLPTPPNQNHFYFNVNQGLSSSSQNNLNVNQMTSPTFQSYAVVKQSNNLVNDPFVQSGAFYEDPPMLQFNQQYCPQPLNKERMTTNERVTTKHDYNERVTTKYDYNPFFSNGVIHNQHYPSRFYHSSNHHQWTQLVEWINCNQQFFQSNESSQVELGHSSQNLMPRNVSQVELVHNSQNLMPGNAALSAKNKPKETVRWTEEEHRCVSRTILMLFNLHVFFFFFWFYFLLTFFFLIFSFDMYRLRFKCLIQWTFSLGSIR